MAENRIILGDCIKEMRNLTKESFQLVLTDPPYNIGTKKMEWKGKKDGGDWKKISEEWDSFSFEDYIEFNNKWIREASELLKPNGTMMICCSQHNIGEVIMALKHLEYKLLNIITWKKTNPMPNMTRRVLTHSTEFIVWAAKGSNYIFNYDDMKKHNEGKQLKDVWEFPLCQGKERIKGEDNKAAHPSQKPLALINRLVEMATNEGDLILDPFLGSGTTMESSIKFNRHCIGIEASEKYYKVAMNRFNDILGINNDSNEEEQLLSVNIENRRYLGNKNKLLTNLDDIINEKCENIESFCDIFAGTGVVGNHFNNTDTKIISNDLLFSNYISLNAWLSDGDFSEKKIKEIIHNLNNSSALKENYVSEHFGNTYFTLENARKIGFIREEIEKMHLNKIINFKEKSVLLTSLLYAMDKSANTFGHYDAFRKKMDNVEPLLLKLPSIDKKKNLQNEIFNQNANDLIRNIYADVIYIDPPYNSRQYSGAYHLLENIMKWEKPELLGVAKKMDRTNLISDYSLKSAPKAFDDLIRNANCRYLLVSYNNTGDKGNDRSNAKISDKEMIEILSQRGEVEIFNFEHKAYTTGKSNLKDNIERVFFVEVKNK